MDLERTTFIINVLNVLIAKNGKCLHGVKPAIYTIQRSCHSKKELNNKTKNLEKQKGKREKINTDCVSFSNVNWYGEWRGYPCKGTKDEKLYRKHLSDKLKKFKENKMGHPNLII